MTALRSEEDGPRGFVPRAELYRALQRVETLEAELADMRDKLAAKGLVYEDYAGE